MLKGEHDPVPFIYSTSVDTPPSLLPTPTTSRKLPSRTTTLTDQLDMFKKQDEIANFVSISKSLSPKNFTPLCNSNRAIFYKMENSTKFDIPIVTQCNVVDEAVCAKLFLNGSPIPLQK